MMRMKNAPPDKAEKGADSEKESPPHKLDLVGSRSASCQFFPTPFVYSSTGLSLFLFG